MFARPASLRAYDPTGVMFWRSFSRQARWGHRDKHLEVAQVLQIARVAQRASLEEVAGSILEWTEQNHPMR